MIPKAAIRTYLHQKRDDFRGWKKLSLEDLEACADELPTRPPIWKKLRHHQKVCFLLGAATKRFAFFCDTGTGKSLLALSLARFFIRCGHRRFLVLIPNRINKYEWSREIAKHSPDTAILIPEGNSRQKLEAIQTTEAHVVIETYMGLIRMACVMLPNKNGVNRLHPDYQLVRKLAHSFDGLILDESHSVKNRSTLYYRVCLQLAKACKVVFVMTGTPFGRDPIDLWAQMKIVDDGESLGKTLGLFRAAFFREEETPWSVEYKFIPKKKGLLNRFLANRSIRYRARAADLPRVTEIIKAVHLPTDAQTYYDKAKKLIIKAGGNYREIKNAFLRMRQISSGFLGYHDDELGERAKFEFPENPKLEMLLSLLESIPDKKAVVFHDFIYSGELIARHLRDAEILYRHIYGKTKNFRTILRDFDDDPTIRILLLSNSMAAGLNLQVAEYAIYYESPTSVIRRVQTRRRVERQESQHKRIFLYDLVTRGTVDEQILEFHKEGKDLFEAIIEGKVSPI